MITTIIEPKRDPFIQPFYAIPSIRSSDPTTLVLLPVLVLSGALLIHLLRRYGFGDKVWTALIVASAFLVGLSTFTPVAEYLWGGHIFRQAWEWLPTRILQAALWTIPLTACILLGLKGRRRLATAAASGLATYYLVYPVVYTYFQGYGFLVPGHLEAASIATAVLIFAEFARRDGIRRASPVVETVIIVAILSSAIAWFIASETLMRLLYRPIAF
ncbi:hypothetical protein [Rhizobium sp. BK176]|uniref:hypothetical protein n=1 Tax=Rhizobium sp. BK176 TaxID=2587071 RepID=UPI0021685AB2|nr:hypothetical protein [Rhizobium sp. BK176]MCS4089784.1 hypothetical protein [Rhizobium sp. BK176]